MEKVTYKSREKYAIIARVLQNFAYCKILLPKKIYVTIVNVNKSKN